MTLLTNRLYHSATIQRATTTTDEWGNPGPPTWTDHLTDLPCRAWTTAGREVVANATTVVVVEDLRLICALGTDVTVADRVSVVTYRGDVIFPGPAAIRAVLQTADHLELILVSLA